MGTYCTTLSWLPSTGVQSHLFMGLSSSVISTATLVTMISRKERLIESYLSKRYTVPLTASAMVTGIVEDLVTFDVYRLLFNRDGGIQENTNIKERYDMALAWLNDLREGRAELIDDTGSTITEKSVTNRYFISTRNYVPTFDVGDPLSWRVSPTRQDDIDNDKESDS